MTSGKLSSEEHQTIVQQLDKLYELQEIKKKNGSDSDASRDDDGPTQMSVDSQKTRTDTKSTVALPPPSGVVSQMRDGRERADMYVDQDGPAFNDRVSKERGRAMRPPHRGHPPQFESYPPNERGFPPRRGRPPPDHYRGRRPYDRRGGFRPPRGPEWPDRGRYFNGPPRGRGRALPGPPPPWHDPMEDNGETFHVVCR